MKKNALSIVCLALAPFTRLLQLYNANAASLLFLDVLVVAGLMSILLLAEYAVLRLALKNHFSALLLCVLTCAAFFLEPFLVRAAEQLSNAFHLNRIWPGFLLFLLVFAGLAVFLFRLGKKLPKEANVFFTLLVAFVLVMNGAPAVSRALARGNEAQAWKDDFRVEAGTKSPNIYWFHMDGMLNNQTMERYFGVSAAPLEQALAQRGFASFPGATLMADHFTALAIPSLTCPAYYDQSLAAVLASAPPNQRPGIRFYETAPPGLSLAKTNNELLTAFSKKGYATRLLALNTGDSYQAPSTKYYAVAEHNTVSNVRATGYPYIAEEGDVARRTRGNQLEHLLLLLLDEAHAKQLARKLAPEASRQAPLTQLPSQEEIEAALLHNEKAMFYYSSLVKSLYDELQTASSPRLTLIHDMMTHCPYIFSKDGSFPYPNDEFDVRNYPTHHEYCFDVTMNLVDMVLAKDPSAIIVLIGDHGIHSAFCEKQLLELYGEQGRVDLWTNIFYAVRIPGEWDPQPDLAMLADPRNLSRYLVNTFVGPNYTYITP